MKCLVMTAGEASDVGCPDARQFRHFGDRGADFLTRG